MTLRVAVQTDRIEGVDEIRERLGDSGTIRGSLTPVLREAARVGAATARQFAPKGSTGRLKDNIADDAIVFRVRDNYITARFGVQPVRAPGRGSPLYPIYVHEGTGLYGRIGKIITAKRAVMMVFPGGGKPWPVIAGRTGVVKKLTVRGQRPQAYMTAGYEAANAYINEHLDDVARDLID